MKADILWTILERELNASKANDAWDLPSGTRITVFLKGSTSPFAVSKVTSIQPGEGYLAIDSDDGRVFTHLDEIMAVRVDEEARPGREARLGFS